jgi:hypothetical protein|tara:strand:+ start:2939 stop:4060 length:1122 start_codon:yes stop_codon:yes gene_type:complete
MIKPLKDKLTHRQDDPFYEVGGERYFSRDLAMTRAQEMCVTPDPNEVWGHAKFIVSDNHYGPEPEKSFKQLYIERAKQIREDNQYVRIWASGGTDSTHVINAFKEAGVEPDELTTYIQYPGSVDVSQNIEVNTGCREILRRAREWWPNVKFTTYDILPEHYYSYAHDHLEHYMNFSSIDPFACNWQMLYEIYPELLEHDKSVQVANIFGGPCLVMGKDEKGWYYRHNDREYNDQLNAPYQLFFFCDSDSKDLTLKILHSMKKTLADSADKQFENYDFWRNDVEMLDYWTTGPDYFRTKARKGNPSDGGIIGYETKGLLRFNNVISSLMGQKTLIAFLVGLNEIQNKNTHWYNDNHILNDWIGMLSPKCYFEKP